MKKYDKLFSIGEISRICDISVASLRHYDKMGVIKPTLIDNETNYRYFDENTIPFIVMLRYYQTLGFQLHEIKELLECNSLEELQSWLHEQDIKLTEKARRAVMVKDRLNDWSDSIKEAQCILADSQNDVGISVRYIPPEGVFFCDPNIKKYMSLKHLLANSDFDQSTINADQITCGSLYALYPSFKTRMEGKIDGVRLFTRRHPLSPPTANVMEYGGWRGVTAYHKHSYNSINETYTKMLAWSKRHNFQLRGDTIERYVSDIWCGKNEDCYVTEIILPLKTE